MSDQSPQELSDKDRDSLHVLPLSILPLETVALRHARMIKNARLESVIECFSGPGSGSGQMEVEDLAGEFDWPETPTHPDLILLRKLAMIPSFDVYSLRIQLREHGVKVDNIESLKLSESKSQELSSYMTDFTHPLISQIYGADDVDVQDFKDIITLFRDPDVKKARKKLETMSEKLGIGLEEIPTFLEDYGDIFLSLSYYRQCLDSIEPVIDQFMDALSEIRKNHQLSNDANLMKTCDLMQTTINAVVATIAGRFETFDRSSKDMWNDISAARFKKLEELIKSYHTTIGGVLCALSVKMSAWSALFPDKDSGGPVKRSEFIMSELKQGIDKIVKIEKEVSRLAGIQNLEDSEEEEEAKEEEAKEEEAKEEEAKEEEVKEEEVKEEEVKEEEGCIVDE